MMKETGISLIEVVTSMTILAVGVLGLAPLMMISIYGNTYSSDMTQANALAQQEVETLVNWSDYGSLPLVTVTDSVAGVYKVTRTVIDHVCSADVPVGLVQISVVVTWTDKKQQERNVYYSTLKPVV